MTSNSALYAGAVMHQRLRPLRHRLRYRVFSLLVDLDELPALDRRLRFFSVNRFNLFSLHERDYASGRAQAVDMRAAEGLRAEIDARLASAGLAADGPILLLTMPRILGYAFNPLSVYFCHDAAGRLRVVLYEVNNTFGERHGYLVEVAPDEADGARVVQQCAKAMHVSPFLPLALRYDFKIEAPAADRARLAIGVRVGDEAGAILAATLHARREALSDRALLRVFATHPLLTLKVIGAIHWEALRLWLKGARVFRKPAPPAQEVSVVTTPPQLEERSSLKAA